MEFIDQIKALSEKVSRLKEQIQTEEATKNAFIMPFIQTLGYDVFNPTEVIPEYVADIGIKKGEKVDYCILKDGHPVLIIECKHWKADLNVHDSQLHRYFHVTKARFGILTNGITYRFYSDLEQPNKMDDKPFLEFSITEIKEHVIEELKKFQKNSFNIEDILSSASELKYSKEVRSIMANQLANPSEEFVKFFASKFYDGRITAKLMEQFSFIVKKSLNQFISDTINDRLKAALANEKNSIVEEKVIVVANEPIVSSDENKIVTTEEEIEGFFIVKSILRNHVRSTRINYRDYQSYFNILLDDNRNKMICRLYLNGSKKFIGVFDSGKSETKIQIESLEDIYNCADKLIETALRFSEEGKKETV
ncbi:MAG: type I restriction endonuclease [Cytophagaceae bacterium]